MSKLISIFDCIKLYKEGKLPKTTKPVSQRKKPNTERKFYVEVPSRKTSMGEVIFDGVILTPEEYKILMKEKLYTKPYKTKIVEQDDLNRIINNISTDNIQPSMPRAKKVQVPVESQLVAHPVLNDASVIHIRLSKPQLKKVKYGHTFRIHPKDINPADVKDKDIVFPFKQLGRHNRVLLDEAKSTGQPRRIVLMDEELVGSGIKEFFQGVGRFFKNNWSTIKPIVSTVLDMGAPALAKAFPQASPAILSGRELIRKTTGVGVGGSFRAKGMCAGRLAKGSPEAKAHMAKLRAMRGKKPKMTTGGRVSVMGGSFSSR
jgi:hypothetical protein